LRKATTTFVMSVCPSARPHGTTRLPLDGIFTKFDIWIFLEKLLRTFKFYWNLKRITGILHEDKYTFKITSHSILRMRNVSGKVLEKIKHAMFNNFSLNIKSFMSQCAKIAAQPDRPPMIKRRMRTACWIPRAQVLQYLLLFHCNNGCTNEPQSYVIYTRPSC
jgi:hypothetical protein